MSPSILPVTPESQAKTKAKSKSKEGRTDRSEKKKSSKKRSREDADATEKAVSSSIESPSKRAKTASGATYEYNEAAIDRNGDKTPIYEQTASFYLPLSPVSLGFPIRGLCAEHISPLILTYYPPLDGILLSYRNVLTSEFPPASSTIVGSTSLAKQVDEYAASFVWLTADFIILKLRKGVYVDGVVNLQSESHLGLILWNLFTASIPREFLPQDWEWQDGTGNDKSSRSEKLTNGWSNDAQEQHGHFVDGEGQKLPRQVSFRIRDFEAAPASEGDRGFVSITGSLLSEEDDAELDAKAREDAAGEHNSSSARGQDLSAGNAEPDRRRQLPNGTGENGRKGKHRISY